MYEHITSNLQSYKLIRKACSPGDVGLHNSQGITPPRSCLEQELTPHKLDHNASWCDQAWEYLKSPHDATSSKRKHKRNGHARGQKPGCCGCGGGGCCCWLWWWCWLWCWWCAGCGGGCGGSDTVLMTYLCRYAPTGGSRVPVDTTPGPAPVCRAQKNTQSSSSRK